MRYVTYEAVFTGFSEPPGRSASVLAVALIWVSKPEPKALHCSRPPSSAPFGSSSNSAPIWCPPAFCWD